MSRFAFSLAAPLLAPLLALLLAGCASTYDDPAMTDQWTHPSKDALEFRADVRECERFFGANERERLRCIQNKGWTPVKKKK
jgi:hypothetical protein